MEQLLFDGEFFKKLNSLKLNIHLRLNKGSSGSRKSSAKGSSLEFSDFREYILGDDIRHIDWNAYGRTDKLLVKLFMEEKEGHFHIFVDGSKSMDFGADNKSVSACRIAGALSYLVLNNLDRVYLTTLKKEGICSSKGLTGRQAFGKIRKQLEDSVFESETEIDSLVKKTRFYGKGVSIIISDFYLTEDIEKLVKFLASKKQEIIFIHTLSEEELNPLMEGTLNLIDSESKENIKITMNSSMSKKYHQTLTQFTNHIREICKRYGATYVLAPSYVSIDRLFFEIFGQAGIVTR